MYYAQPVGKVWYLYVCKLYVLYIYLLYIYRVHDTLPAAPSPPALHLVPGRVPYTVWRTTSNSGLDNAWRTPRSNVVAKKSATQILWCCCQASSILEIREFCLHSPANSARCLSGVPGGRYNQTDFYPTNQENIPVFCQEAPKNSTCFTPWMFFPRGEQNQVWCVKGTLVYKYYTCCAFLFGECIIVSP